MDYSETLHYLYTSVPVFQHSGASAYKPGLQTSAALDNYLGNPHRAYRTIHVAGTNGKGSTSHLLAAVLHQSGYRVGLYTSPHLVDFRERIRVNGEKIPESYVVDFVERHHSFFQTLHPSFFELTMCLAFDYFRAAAVDVAVIEVGLGGRLDSTNIITPQLAVITNISLDHVQFLGDTVEKIAAEKAGIIKPGIPVVIGEAEGDVRRVFEEKAAAANAPLFFAEEEDVLAAGRIADDGRWKYRSADYGPLDGELGGEVQIRNTRTVLSALRRLTALGFAVRPEAVREAFARVTALTGLTGRWQLVQERPRTVCDTAHNTGGMAYIARQLARQTCDTLHLVIGMVDDKDINGVLALLPASGRYYFTRASVARALPAGELAAAAARHGLIGKTYATVKEAVDAARTAATENDFIYIGGSTFVVADALSTVAWPGPAGGTE